ncbi:type I glyceraldehyde-3-phosphate dehydrogenase [Desulfoluna limicola]|uniref:type I glyceraldehyde-3-phosphate dehydrogenase n=1 Tax=Desulfoluna limicola TaxID=2810562 RepID=UPI001F030FD7|nr:type I glyceraldehyde-3-phosphate dehydrogenase [Desulfoluna limicola]
MTYRVAINGYGRIGRCILRALYESAHRDDLVIVGINELSDIESIAHLTKYDSTHGRFNGDVTCEGHTLIVNGDPIAVTYQKELSRLNWDKLDVDVVLECTGSFTQRSLAEKHLEAGAKKVVFSCPAEPDVDATIVYGINHDTLKKEHTVVSNASCTTNCIVPVIKTLDESFGIESGVITTVHSMMNDQPVIDAYHDQDLRKTRSSSHSIIPVNTGLAKGLDRIMPELAGRFEALSLRVPTLNVSAMQLTAQVREKTDSSQVNDILKKAANNGMNGILGYTEVPLVSCDYNHDPRSSVVDGTQTRVSGHTVSVLAWFDNEWGYASRMLDTTLALMQAAS